MVLLPRRSMEITVLKKPEHPTSPPIPLIASAAASCSLACCDFTENHLSPIATTNTMNSKSVSRLYWNQRRRGGRIGCDSGTDMSAKN